MATRRAPTKKTAKIVGKPAGQHVHKHRPLHIPLSRWMHLVDRVLDWYLSSAHENIDRERVRSEMFEHLDLGIWKNSVQEWIAGAIGVPEYPFWYRDDAPAYGKALLGEVAKQLGRGAWGAKRLQSLFPGKVRAMTPAEAEAAGLPPLSPTAKRLIALVDAWTREEDLWNVAGYFAAKDVELLLDGASFDEMSDFTELQRAAEGMSDRDRRDLWEAVKHDAILLHQRRMRAGR